MPLGYRGVMVQAFQVGHRSIPAVPPGLTFLWLHLAAAVEATRRARHDLDEVVRHALLLDPPDDVLDVAEAVSQRERDQHLPVITAKRDFLEVGVPHDLERQVPGREAPPTQPVRALAKHELEVAARRAPNGMRGAAVLPQQIVAGDRWAVHEVHALRLHQAVELCRRQDTVDVRELRTSTQLVPRCFELLVIARGDETVVHF
mmetsp:Transcript_3876/g.9896  ORF Transcript_3876/g.9896 Transcript_3876/m.9896 type:complete len:203 (+) Transcript_3876:136-744(+)